MKRGMTIVAVWFLGSCTAMPPSVPGDQQALQGEVKIDGSSTVYLISEAVASQFKKEHAGVNISVGLSGTGGGFKKLANGETDIQDASRAIKEAEVEKCKANGIEYTAIQVAWDGIAVVVNKENTWAARMTLAQLKKIWQPDGHAKTWKDVDPNWPDEKIDLYGPGPDSGTFDYFTEAVNGKERVTRKDYNASGDPNTMVQGVTRSKYALAYLGLAYVESNKGKLTDVAIADQDGNFIAPTSASVLSRQYPLSRPLYIYVGHKAMERAAVRAFARFYVRRTDLASSVGYIPLNTLQHARERQKLEKAIKAASQ